MIFGDGPSEGYLMVDEMEVLLRDAPPEGSSRILRSPDGALSVLVDSVSVN
jgi:hypothetical protein